MPKNRLAVAACLIAAWLALPVAGFAGQPTPHQPEAGHDTNTAAAPAASDVARLVRMVLAEETGALESFCDALADAGVFLPEDIPDAGAPTSGEEREAFDQLRAAAALALRARAHAWSVLGNPDFSDDLFPQLIGDAVENQITFDALKVETMNWILRAARDADDLRSLRLKVLERYQREHRRRNLGAGTRIAWGMIRVGQSGPDTMIDPGSLKFSSRRARVFLVHRGVPMRLAMEAADADKHVRASVHGFNFVADWAVLFQKPLGWMAFAAEEMRRAGVSPETYPDWEVMEGPGGVLALSIPPENDDTATRMIFFRGGLRQAAMRPPPADADRMAEAFRRAARALHEGIVNDERIAQPLRQALRPVLMGAYLPIDSRDYFDADFCRRLIEADYLEAHVKPMPPERVAELDAYRAALGRLEAGYDEFTADLGDGRTLAAVVTPDFEGGDGERKYVRDMDSGEILPRYTWRIEGDEATTFFSIPPARGLYAFSLADRYPGRHRTRPSGVSERTAVWHAALGEIASFQTGDDAATGSREAWLEAVTLDTGGRSEYSTGPLGWNYPLHVLQRDDQGDPVLLATLDGVVPSPDFNRVEDAAARRKAQDEWLDLAARVLATPGELGLIYHQFFRYCSDSPLPEMPNLIGSHYGLSDTHQTVYQSLERRWVGRLIGDCDDLAEFFQVLTARQGKLSHVMQVPAHAAAGYVERTDEGGYRFVVLQTGPVLQFVEATLNGAVEKAYRHFDDDGGRSHFSAAAVPILLRFADEETRTPFVLSSRIYEDADYAEAMIRVQEYWHLWVFSAAIAEMEAMLETDREVGNLKELASLYERVGRYEDSAALRREELEAVAGDPQSTLSTLLDIAQLHIQDKDKPKAVAALSEMEALMRGLIDDGNEAAYARAASFRSYWAILLSRLGEPARAWGLMRREVEASRRAGRRIADSVLRTLVVMYDKIALNTQIAGAAPDDGEGAKAWRELTGVIEGALADGYFRADDGYNSILRRYFVVGRFAVARGGRANGVEKLNEDGPYPDGPKNHTRRGARLTEDDWAWMRIAPQLYLAYAQEFLDQDEYPEIYSPEAAKTMLENVARAVAKGTGLGSDVMGGDDLVKSSLTLAFVTNDLESFRGILRTVRDRDYSSLYDDAAVVFGSYCGLIPRAEFAPWIEAFHEAFAGRQHYFKAVYRALDKEHHDHGLALARATAGFFPEDRLLVDEAAYVESIVPRLKERKARRQAMEPLLEVAAAGMFRGFRGVRVLGEAERVFELRIKN